MYVIGILGGVASGKSQIARRLVEFGCGLLDADRAGHEVLRQPEVVRALAERWGSRVVGGDGQIERSAVAAIVFAAPESGDDEKRVAAAERKYLEQLTHPRIGQLLADQKDQFAASGAVKAVVLDAALMMEAGWDAMCDQIVFADAPREIRLARARLRGWTEAEFDAREAAQETLQAKRQRADFVIDTSGSLEHCREQVERFWRSRLGTIAGSTRSSQ